MCGISGIINKKNSSIEKNLIKSMNDLISYRGPDDEGFYFGKNFALGHRRLSILDLSKDGHQPMDYGESLTIIFNGEVYNYLEIRTELQNKGYPFYSKTDTEVILASYKEWGEDCVSRFNGMWSFILYDRKKNILFCSRDRFGVKPFYFTESNDYFAIGSEVKQFTSLPGWKAQMNTPRVTDYLIFGIFDHTEETLFKKVYQLRGGHNLIYHLDSHEKQIKKWYDLESKVKTYDGSFDDAKSKFNDLLSSSIELRLRSDVKVGSCLSGGLDSSSIVCIMNELLLKEGKTEMQETVSSCFDDPKFDEQKFIDEVVKFTNVKSHKVKPNLDEFLKKVDQILWHQDEPFGSMSIFAQWNVFEEARKNNLIVMLDGQGADEILGGYHLFYLPKLTSLLRKGEIKEFQQEVSSIGKIHRQPARLIFKQLFRFLAPSFIAKTDFGRKFNNFRFLKNNFPLSKLYKPSKEVLFRKTSLDQLLVSNLPMLLHYEDRDSMAHSIESRIPFLDYRVVEFALGLPDSYKIEKGITKRLLRESLKGRIPNSITERFDKMAFVTPETEWIKENKIEFEKQLIQALDLLKDLLEKQRVLKAFHEDFNHIKMGSIYWRIFCLGRWMKLFKVSSNHEF